MKRTILGVVSAGLLALAAMPAGAQDKVQVRLDWVNSGYHALWYYAKDQGVFAKHRLDLEVLEGRGSAVTAQTVGNKSVMFGTADAGATMGLVSKGLPVQIVASYLRTGPMAIVFPVKNGWKDFKDMAGAQVGFSPGGASAVLFHALMKKTGLEGKVRIVNTEPAAKPIALLEGRVNAIESFGFLQKPILDAKGMPTTYMLFSQGGVNVPGLALVTHKDNVTEKKDIVQRMVTAMREALALVQTNPEAAMDSLMKVAPNLDRAPSLEALKESFKLFDSTASKGRPLGWTPPDDIKTAQDVLIEGGQIEKALPIETYFTNSFVPAGA
ncbi:MAG: ABC transporter substrate-binding protein [Alphaproteobacteria bacterium]|nr:ABC transporter substrate-binding protein [Alphaproteobacteria bacterium]